MFVFEAKALEFCRVALAFLLLRQSSIRCSAVCLFAGRFARADEAGAVEREWPKDPQLSSIRSFLQGDSLFLKLHAQHNTFPRSGIQEVRSLRQLGNSVSWGYEKLKTVKQSLLEKMFPKEGEDVPELRFEGFTDPWEQRKLGEIAHRVTRKNEEGASDLPLTISAQHGLVDQRDFFGSQVASRDMRGYYLLEKGEFAYNKSTSGDSPWGAVKRLARYEKGCLSTLYICFGLDVGDPSFLVTYYETNRWHKGIRLIAAEGARNHGLSEWPLSLHVYDPYRYPFTSVSIRQTFSRAKLFSDSSRFPAHADEGR